MLQSDLQTEIDYRYCSWDPVFLKDIFTNTLIGTDFWKLHTNAFDYIRGHMGIGNVEDLIYLKYAPKDKIDYNKFDKKL